jgi:hypothetical protein
MKSQNRVSLRNCPKIRPALIFSFFSIILSHPVFADEVDLVAHFGHPILALQSSDRAHIREIWRDYERIETETVQRSAQYACKMAGFARVKEFTTTSSADSEVWVLKRENPNESWRTIQTSSELCSAKARPSYFGRPAVLGKSGDPGSLKNIFSTPLMCAAVGTIASIGGRQAMLAPATVHLCSIIGFVWGTLLVPIKLVGYACENISDHANNAYDPENLNFDRLICE